VVVVCSRTCSAVLERILSGLLKFKRHPVIGKTGVSRSPWVVTSPFRPVSICAMSVNSEQGDVGEVFLKAGSRQVMTCQTRSMAALILICIIAKPSIHLRRFHAPGDMTFYPRSSHQPPAVPKNTSCNLRRHRSSMEATTLLDFPQWPSRRAFLFQHCSLASAHYSSYTEPCGWMQSIVPNRRSSGVTQTRHSAN
jgi:hypothetical protein